MGCGIIQLYWVWQWIIQLCWVVRSYVILHVGNLLTPSVPYLTNDSALFFDCHSYYVSTWIVSAWRPETWALRNIVLVCPSNDIGYSLTWNCKGGQVLAFYGGIVPTLAPFLLYFSDDVVCECSWEVFQAWNSYIHSFKLQECLPYRAFFFFRLRAVL